MMIIRDQTGITLDLDLEQHKLVPLVVCSRHNYHSIITVCVNTDTSQTIAVVFLTLIVAIKVKNKKYHV